jgi:hypothetical protein
MKKIVLSILAVLLLTGTAYPFNLYIFPYAVSPCAGKIGGYSYDYKSFLYPNSGYTSVYHIEEIPDNEIIVQAILSDWNCNRFPDGKAVNYVIDAIKAAVSDATDDMGFDNTVPITRTGHMSYGPTCPLFCIDSTGNLIYRGTDPSLQIYFTQ